MSRLVRQILPLAALAVGAAVLAGCGGSANSASAVYSVAKTKACLVKKHVRIGGQLDFVASTATGGALRARLPGNGVTIAFGQTLSDAANIDQAYVHFHGKNVGIADVLRTQGNAVMLWRQHPSDQDLSLVQGCLSS